MRNSILAMAAAMMTLPLAAPAAADPPPWAPAHGARHKAQYDRDGRYLEPRRLGRNDRVWRDNDGRYRCRRENGTTGLIIGGAAGALLGREVDGGRDRTLGTILGGAAGALLGREVDGHGLRCR